MTSRIDIIGQNGPTGEHYDATRAAFEESANFEPTREHYELSRPATPRGYIGLQAVLDRAFEQAAFGKGHVRHARGQAFEDQAMQKLIDLYGVGFAFGQAAKKMQEAQGMLLRGELDAAVREMLGAIVYAAGVVIHEEKKNG